MSEIMSKSSEFLYALKDYRTRQWHTQQSTNATMCNDLHSSPGPHLRRGGGRAGGRLLLLLPSQFFSVSILDEYMNKITQRAGW